jgi:hypothetical protein
MSMGDRVVWVGLFATLMLCLARAMIEHDPFPWWSSDPFVFAPPLTGLTPRWALLLNTCILLSSTLTVVGQFLRGRPASSLQSILILIGFAVIGYHARTDLERTLDASTIAAVIAALVAGATASTLPGAPRVLGGVCVGFAIMLTLVGAYEVHVSHPQTLEIYEQGRDSFLSARGWSEGSFEAMSYERRLRNPEPVAWFGLTNVFASFAAASAGALFTFGLGCYRTHRSYALAYFIAALACGYSVYLCNSKGGFAVLAIGIAMGAATQTRIREWLNGQTLLILCGLTIGALLLRGMLGEAIGERSLLFRYQYLVGAMNIWIADPLLGCGPGLFQDRYALLKPALSPEDVASPHSVLFAWIATLGIGGVALCVVLCRSVLRYDMDDPEYTLEGPDSTPLIKIASLLIALACLVSLQMQTAVLGAMDLAPILLGMLIWIGLAAFTIRPTVPDQVLRAGVLVAAGVLLVHAMIEVTGTLIVSAPLWAFMLGIAVQERKPRGSSRLGHACTAGGGLVLTAVLLAMWGPLNRWERSLHAGAHDAVPIADVRALVNGLEYTATPEIDADRISSALSSLLGVPVGRSLDSIIPALNQAEFSARAASVDHLRDAIAAYPSHTPTRIAASQQMLWVASIQIGIGRPEDASRTWDDATELFADQPLDAQGQRWLGNIWLGRVSAFPESTERERWIREAIDAFEGAYERTPNDPHLSHQIMTLWLELGSRREAVEWAERSLSIHERMRLDPIRGLDEAALAQARDVAED